MPFVVDFEDFKEAIDESREWLLVLARDLKLFKKKYEEGQEWVVTCEDPILDEENFKGRFFFNSAEEMAKFLEEKMLYLGEVVVSRTEIYIEGVTQSLYEDSSKYLKMKEEYKKLLDSYSKETKDKKFH